MNFIALKRLLQIRSQIYELLAHCIPADLVLKQLTLNLLKTMDNQIKGSVLQCAAEYVRVDGFPIASFKSFNEFENRIIGSEKETRRSSIWRRLSRMSCPFTNAF